MNKTEFRNCSLHEVDFTDADLSEASFQGADLADACFDHTQLVRADFRDAHNIHIDPERNQIRKARFSAHQLPGLLDKYDLTID